MINMITMMVVLYGTLRGTLRFVLNGNLALLLKQVSRSRVYPKIVY